MECTHDISLSLSLSLSTYNFLICPFALNAQYLFGCSPFWENKDSLHICIHNFLLYTILYFMMSLQYICSHHVMQYIMH